MHDGRVIALGYAHALLRKMQTPPMTRLAPSLQFLCQSCIRTGKCTISMGHCHSTRLPMNFWVLVRRVFCGSKALQVSGDSLTKCIARWFLIREEVDSQKSKLHLGSGERRLIPLNYHLQEELVVIIEALWNVALHDAVLGAQIDHMLGLKSDASLDAVQPFGETFNIGYRALIDILGRLVFSRLVHVHFSYCHF